jgi:hypothetical protein
LGLAAGLAALYGVLRLQGPEAHLGLISYAPAVPCLAIIMVIVAGEWRRLTREQWAATGLTRGVQRPRNGRRVATRLAGFFATLALIGFAYWLLPEYAGSFYQPFWNYLRTLAPLLLLVPFYFMWLDRRLAEQGDEYLAFGRLVLGRWGGMEPALIRRHLLGWTIKGFFLPLMTVYLANEIAAAYHAYGAGSIHAITRYDFL